MILNPSFLSCHKMWKMHHYLIVKVERDNKFPKEVKTMQASVVKVQDVLLWLRENSVLYSDLDIPMSVNNHTF